MKVKVLKNFIYDGAFHQKGEVFDMRDSDVTDFERRHWVIRQLQAEVEVPKAPQTLPPLEAEPARKKK